MVSHHGRSRTHVTKTAHHPRYAYSVGIFLPKPPAFDTSPLPGEAASKIARAFNSGNAEDYAARSLVRAGVVKYHPLHGGIFWRREPVKYIIVHSTETGVPQSAERVIESWSSGGIRHAGAQYVVDRDGTIFQAVDPDLATVHVNIFKTLPGINNDNSIGIEMCHCGGQTYPQEQRDSVTKLVTYLQQRYKVTNDNIITHRYAQQGDHTDPVAFDFEGFLATKENFRNRAIAYRVKELKEEARDWQVAPPEPTTYLQPHKALPASPDSAPAQEPAAVGRSVTAEQVDKSKSDDSAVTEAKPQPVEPAAAATGTANAQPARTPAPAAAPAPKVASPASPPAAPNQTQVETASSSPRIKSVVAPLRGPIEMPPDSVSGISRAVSNDSSTGHKPGAGASKTPVIPVPIPAVIPDTLLQTGAPIPTAP